jgi:hypothetical protein
MVSGGEMSNSGIVETVIHTIWEDHVHSGDEVIESCERILKPILLAAVAMRNSYPVSQDARAMWDEAVKELVTP